jgi:hypothetical protein
MSDLDLSKLREVAEGATAGPWRPVHDDDPMGQPVCFYHGLVALVERSGQRSLSVVVDDGRTVDKAQWDANATHIATFDPPTCKALIDRVRRAEAMLGYIQEDCNSELTRRRNPGGLQAGLPRLAGVPLSVLKALERDCRHALEAAK